MKQNFQYLLVLKENAKGFKLVSTIPKAFQLSMKKKIEMKLKMQILI